MAAPKSFSRECDVRFGPTADSCTAAKSYSITSSAAFSKANDTSRHGGQTIVCRERNDTIVSGIEVCIGCNEGLEEYKAWSQNLGHEHVLTTFCSYGDVSSHRQTEILRSLSPPEPT